MSILTIINPCNYKKGTDLQVFPEKRISISPIKGCWHVSWLLQDISVDWWLPNILPLVSRCSSSCFRHDFLVKRQKTEIRGFRASRFAEIDHQVGGGGRIKILLSRKVFHTKTLF